jgi:hypothetical protein
VVDDADDMEHGYAQAPVEALAFYAHCSQPQK